MKETLREEGKGEDHWRICALKPGPMRDEAHPTFGDGERLLAPSGPVWTRGRSTPNRRSSATLPEPPPFADPTIWVWSQQFHGWMSFDFELRPGHFITPLFKCFCVIRLSSTVPSKLIQQKTQKCTVRQSTRWFSWHRPQEEDSRSSAR